MLWFDTRRLQKVTDKVVYAAFLLKGGQDSSFAMQYNSQTTSISQQGITQAQNRASNLMSNKETDLGVVILVRQSLKNCCQSQARQR